MKALILAGGYGTRLKAFGEQLPKGLIPFQNTTLIDQVINQLAKENITEIVVVTNGKYFNQYYEWSKNKNNKITILNDKTTTPEERLGAIGDLIFTIKEFGWQNENIIVSPSDTYFTFPIKSFLNIINNEPEHFATILRQMNKENIKNRLGCAVVENGRIIDFVEKPEDPPTEYGAVPFYYYPASIHQKLSEYEKEGNSMDAPGSIIPWLLKNNYPINACIVTDRTIDVGTLNDVEELKGVK